MMKIDFSKIPKYYLLGANLKTPRDISDFFIKNNIKLYCYDVSVINASTGALNCAKKGMSADIKSDFGDRVYRQMAHLKSWSDGLRILGSSGAEFINVAELFEKRYGYPIDHKNCIITIYDMTNYPFRGMNARIEILAAEELLILEHVKQFGEKPPGNLIESYLNSDRAIIEKLHFEGLFMVEEK